MSYAEKTSPGERSPSRGPSPPKEPPLPRIPTLPAVLIGFISIPFFCASLVVFLVANIVLEIRWRLFQTDTGARASGIKCETEEAEPEDGDHLESPVCVIEHCKEGQERNKGVVLNVDRSGQTMSIVGGGKVVKHRNQALDKELRRGLSGWERPPPRGNGYILDVDRLSRTMVEIKRGRYRHSCETRLEKELRDTFGEDLCPGLRSRRSSSISVCTLPERRPPIEVDVDSTLFGQLQGPHTVRSRYESDRPELRYPELLHPLPPPPPPPLPPHIVSRIVSERSLEAGSQSLRTLREEILEGEKEAPTCVTEEGYDHQGEESTAKKTSGSIYEALSEGHIRLLSLAPGNDADPVGKLSCHALEDRPSYEALSYVWGGSPSESSPTITIDGAVIKITRNLHAALIALRRDDKYRTLWIDALCINQKDRKERSMQVSMMGEIYGRAANVNIWLGPRSRDAFASAHSDMALDKFQQDFMALVSEDEMIQKPFYRSGGPEPRENFDQNIRSMMNSEWFKRMWVVQECALARKITLHYARWNCTWPAGTITVQLLRRLKFACVSPRWSVQTESVTEMFTSGSEWNPNRSIGQERGHFSPAEWYAPLIRLLELSVMHHFQNRSPPDLLDLLYDMRDKESTNPVDKIYGLMGLGMVECRDPLKVDYGIHEWVLWDRLLHHLQTCSDHSPI